MPLTRARPARRDRALGAGRQRAAPPASLTGRSSASCALPRNPGIGGAQGPPAAHLRPSRHRAESNRAAARTLLPVTANQAPAPIEVPGEQQPGTWEFSTLVAAAEAHADPAAEVHRQVRRCTRPPPRDAREPGPARPSRPAGTRSRDRARLAATPGCAPRSAPHSRLGRKRLRQSKPATLVQPPSPRRPVLQHPLDRPRAPRRCSPRRSSGLQRRPRAARRCDERPPGRHNPAARMQRAAGGAAGNGSCGRLQCDRSGSSPVLRPRPARQTPAAAPDTVWALSSSRIVFP